MIKPKIINNKIYSSYYSKDSSFYFYYLVCYVKVEISFEQENLH